MTYIVMGRDECNEEVRLDEHGFKTRRDAYAWMDKRIDEDYWPEFRSIWVERLRDQFYWAEKFAQAEYEDE